MKIMFVSQDELLISYLYSANKINEINNDADSRTISIELMKGKLLLSINHVFTQKDNFIII